MYQCELLFAIIHSAIALVLEDVLQKIAPVPSKMMMSRDRMIPEQSHGQG